MSRLEPMVLLRRFPPPRAGEDLRERVLAASRDAVARADRPSRADRIWFSASWRLAWAGAIAALALVELISARAAGRAALSGAPPSSEVRESALAAEALGLPPEGWIGGRIATGSDSQLDAKEPL